MTKDKIASLKEKIEKVVGSKGFEGLAKVLLETIKAISRISWYSRNHMDVIKDFLETDKDLEDLPKEFEDFED